MLPQCSHIVRKRGIYAYRRRLPRPHVGEITISLRTRRYRAAEATAEALNITFETFFATRPMSNPVIKHILREYLEAALKELRKVHLQTPSGQPVHATSVSGFQSTVDEKRPTSAASALKTLPRLGSWEGPIAWGIDYMTCFF
jgi:hypothetical protein